MEIEPRARLTLCNTVRDSRNELRSGPTTDWSLEFEVEREDLSDSTSERRDLWIWVFHLIVFFFFFFFILFLF